jgi:NTP pyrophosphatase (non-canonical NTP hydrolase)
MKKPSTGFMAQFPYTAIADETPTPATGGDALITLDMDPIDLLSEFEVSSRKRLNLQQDREDQSRYQRNYTAAKTELLRRLRRATPAAESGTFQREVGEWGNTTFPQSTPNTIIAHLTDEVEEIRGELARGVGRIDANIAEEAADCYMLLLHLAHRIGFDLAEAARSKFESNKKRTWQTGVNERGYFKHIAAADPAPGEGE